MDVTVAFLHGVKFEVSPGKQEPARFVLLIRNRGQRAFGVGLAKRLGGQNMSWRRSWIARN